MANPFFTSLNKNLQKCTPFSVTKNILNHLSDFCSYSLFIRGYQQQKRISLHLFKLRHTFVNRKQEMKSLQDKNTDVE